MKIRSEWRNIDAKCGASWLSEGYDPGGNETLRWSGSVDYHRAGIESGLTTQISGEWRNQCGVATHEKDAPAEGLKTLCGNIGGADHCAGVEVPGLAAVDIRRAA